MREGNLLYLSGLTGSTQWYGILMTDDIETLVEKRGRRQTKEKDPIASVHVV